MGRTIVSSSRKTHKKAHGVAELGQYGEVVELEGRLVRLHAAEGNLLLRYVFAYLMRTRGNNVRTSASRHEGSLRNEPEVNGETEVHREQGET